MFIYSFFSAGEYSDFLSIFLDHDALDLIMYYLKKCNTNNGLLTYSALRFFASLLCHNKVVMFFMSTILVHLV